MKGYFYDNVYQGELPIRLPDGSMMKERNINIEEELRNHMELYRPNNPNGEYSKVLLSPKNKS
jgi:hypothetical protein